MPNYHVKFRNGNYINVRADSESEAREKALAIARSRTRRHKSGIHAGMANVESVENDAARKQRLGYVTNRKPYGND